MTIELTEKNKQELIQRGGTFFPMDITDKEYKTLCRKAEKFLANHMKSQFTNSVNTNAIDNLSPEQLNQVANIFGVK